MPTVIADVFDAAELELLLEIDKHAPNVLNIQVGGMELCIVNLRSEVEPIVGAFIEDSLACADFFICDTDRDFILGIILGERDCRINLNHEAESSIHSILKRVFAVRFTDLLNLVDRFFGLDSKNLHQDAALP